MRAVRSRGRAGSPNPPLVPASARLSQPCPADVSGKRPYRASRVRCASVQKGTEAYEARLREKTLRTVKSLIKSQNINGLELASVLAPT
jgi:hypothetical protein